MLRHSLELLRHHTSVISTYDYVISPISQDYTGITYIPTFCFPCNNVVLSHVPLRLQVPECDIYGYPSVNGAVFSNKSEILRSGSVRF